MIVFPHFTGSFVLTWFYGWMDTSHVAVTNKTLSHPFCRWLSEKYPKIVVDMLEERALRVEGVRVPPDLTRPNPNGIEFDNLYVDMNGIIHPCSHPEGGPQPQTEEEMYVNVFNYVDRLMNAVRPRKLLYLAIDGVAPRAKMNQQRSRRFRSAQEAEELKDIQQAVRVEMADSGHKIPPKAREPWDSNVITPGTRFMHRLSHYLHYYVQHRINTDKAWRSIKVILSDASQPGEGEHKIMEYVRQQRSQPGYDPNQHHILHGLDADLIMLGLATHEPKFTILRELVTFGRKDKEAREAKIKAQQAAFEATSGVIPDETFNAIDGEELGYKPLQMLRVWVLREYLQAEFACLEQTLPFPYDFERVVDDFVFLCFFVGNDFLPHLPSLDIRDGALDFLQNVYKRCLPAIGDYLTAEGGDVNLKGVAVIMAEVGDIEDEVFRRRRANEERELQRRQNNNAQRKAGGAGRVGAAAARNDAVAVGSVITGRNKDARRRLDAQASSADPNTGAKDLNANMEAANKLKEQLKAKLAKKLDVTSDKDAAISPANALVEDNASAGKRKREEGDDEVEEDEDGFEDDIQENQEEDEDAKAEEIVHVMLATGAVEVEMAQSALKSRVKDRMQAQLDKHRDAVEDNVRLWEAGWKDRYYSDKCKVCALMSARLQLKLPQDPNPIPALCRQN
jgi:5'-3' exoribonuclease 2